VDGVGTIPIVTDQYPTTAVCKSVLKESDHLLLEFFYVLHIESNSYYLGQVMLLFLPMAKKETTFVYSYETWKDMIENATRLTNSRPPTPAIPPNATAE
jgi:hypothetical protein